MEKENKLIRAFAESEKSKIETHFNRLFPYLDLSRTVIVGGLAIRYHLLNRGLDYHPRPFNDLDIIVESLDVVSPEVKNDFLIHHFHYPDEHSEFYLALADPVSGTKVDIFDYSLAPQKTELVSFADRDLKVVSPEDQLVSTVIDTYRVTDERDVEVDPKQFLDAIFLFQIADLKKANKYWKKQQLFTIYPDVPKTITEAFVKAQNYVEDHPQRMKEKPARKAKPEACPKCIHNSLFPISPKEEVYKVLGYIKS